MASSTKRGRLLLWAAIDGAAISLLLTIASFVLIDNPLVGILALAATLILFSLFLYLSRSMDEPLTLPTTPMGIDIDSGLPVHPVTGLYRWWVFRERAGDEIARANRQGRILALLLLEPGDLIAEPSNEARVKAADVLRRTVRDGDYAAQFDDSRFVVMLPETATDGARTAANRLLSDLRSSEEPHMAWRAALVSYPLHGSNVDELMGEAQKVLQPGRLESSLRQAG